MNNVNLIPAPRRARQKARRRRATWIRILRAYSLLLALACALAFLPAHADAPSLESSFARVDRRIQAKAKELDAIRAHTAELSRTLDLARAVGDHPDWSALLLSIARCRADLAILESIDLSIVKDEKKDKPGTPPTPASASAKPAQRDSVTLKLLGIAASPEACVQFASALERLDLFDRVAVKDTRAHAFGRMAATHFEIEATLSHTPNSSALSPSGANP